MQQVEMHRFDVSVTCVTTGFPSRTCKMEVIAPNWADAAMNGVKQAGPADRVCLIVSKQAPKKQRGSASLEFASTVALAACFAGLVFNLPLEGLFSPSLQMLDNLNHRIERAA